MSKAIFNKNKEMPISHSYSTKNFYRNKDKSTFSHKDNTNFKKVSGSGIVGTSGLSPIIIYKKTSKGNENKEKYKVKKQIKNTNYISDGGLKQKIEKYNNGFGFPSHNILGQSTQNKTTKHKYNKKHNIFFEEKQKEKESFPMSKKYSNNIIDKKVFSKTVRESNKRPIFQKNTEKMKNCYNTKNGFGVKYNKLHENEVNKNQEQEQEDEKKINEIKFQYMNQLYENGIAHEIRKYQMEKKMTPREMFNERKKILLLDNGIEFENELNNIEEEDNLNEEIKEEENSKNIIEQNLMNMMKAKTPSNNSLRAQIECNPNLFSYDNHSLSFKNKKIYKPRVQQFEFIQKIKKEQQKLSGTSIIKPNISKKMGHNSCSLNDSFRHKINQNSQNVLKNNYINNNDIKENNLYIRRSSEETQSTNDNYPYSHKKSHRSTEELKNFLKLKRMKEKEEKKTKDIENNKKLFVRFKNLYNLSMKDLTEEPYQRIETHIRRKMIKSKSNNNYYGGNSTRRKKEVNEYYIGSEPSLKNNSTLVDQGEYFLHILESQQLLVNSKFKKIDNISDTESNKENEEDNIINNDLINEEFNNLDDINNEDNNDSKLNISKEQINKITDKESKRSENSSAKTTNAINLSNYDELKQKIDNTLKRVSKVFSKENLRKLRDQNSNMESSETTSNNKNNMNKIDNNTSLNDNMKINDKPGNNIQENINKDLKGKSHELNIDLTNVGNQIDNSEVNTKEKNIPSLSHTYSTNSNPNKKVEIEIEPRAVLNLVEILKFIIQRKIFVKLYESYINHSIFQQYNIAFAYFVAICKHYPYRKIEEYANYRTYNFAFRQLFRPFTRRAYKYFVNNCYMKKKVEYFVIILTKMFKFKIMEKIYLYNQFSDEDEQKIYKILLLRIISHFVRYHLKQAFSEFKNKVYSISNINKNNSKKDLKKDSNEEDSELEEKVLKKDILNQPSEKDEDNAKKEKNNKKDIINSKNKKNQKHFFGEENYNFDEENSISNSNSIQKRADVSMKMHSFMHYTSENDSKSSFNIELNSVDNGKLHQLIKKKRLLRNRFLYDGDDELYGYGLDFDGFGYDDHSLESESHKSARSLKDYLDKKNRYGNKTSSDGIEESSSKKSNRDQNIKNFLNENLKKIKLKEECDNKQNEDQKKDNIINNIIDNSNKDDNKEKEKNDKDKNINNESEKEKVKEKDIQNEKDKEKEKGNNKKESNIEEKKRNIKIEIDDIPIIKNEHKHSSTSEIDISAENDINNNDIDWEYNISQNENKSKGKEKEKPPKETKKKNFVVDEEFSLEEVDDNNSDKNKAEQEKINNDDKKEKSNKNESKKSEEDYGSFEDISLGEDNKNKAKKEDKKGENKENFSLISSDNKQDKSRNSKQENKEIKIDANENENEDDSKNDKNNDEEKDSKEKQIKEKLLSESQEKEKDKSSSKESKKKLSKSEIEIIRSIKDANKLSDELTEEIIKDILLNEIKSSKKKLIPTKKFKFDKFDKMNLNSGLNNSLTNSYGSLGDIRTNSSNLSKEFGLNNISYHDDLISLNDSLISNYSAFSVFNKTIKDKKKEHSLKLYLTKIAPILVKIIYKEIIDKYPLIYKNLSKPLKNNSEQFMTSLALQDTEMMKDNYKCPVKEECLESIINKEKILKEFSVINKNIRNKDNVTSDNFYDNMLNDCIIDTTIELMYKERLYGKNGDPFKWSSRTHELRFKYNKNEPVKFANYICKSLLKIIHNRIGLISDNYDYLSPEQINLEKDRRLLLVIKKEFYDNEYQWNNLELEETQLKVEATESILDQLYNEIIEILEHIQFSRKRPELYQNKSIYACEEIPKLSFQQTTSEDMNVMGDVDDLGISP